MDKTAAAIVVLSDSQQHMMEFQQQFMEQRQAQYEPNRERPMERKLQVTALMIAPFNDNNVKLNMSQTKKDQWKGNRK